VVIEDCAHALFATYQGKAAGTWGDIGSFSFQMSKQMGLGDGGMGVTDSEEWAKRLGWFGGAPTFGSVAHGLHWNYRMTEQTAAIGLAQLERARGYVEELIEIGELYDEAVKGCPWLTLQRGPDHARHTFHFWVAGFWGQERSDARGGVPLDDFKRVLQEEGCSVSMGYTVSPPTSTRSSRTGWATGEAARWIAPSTPASRTSTPTAYARSPKTSSRAWCWSTPSAPGSSMSETPRRCTGLSAGSCESEPADAV
jgi:dTDP-4-amino-4,6-dideoxygalactose transaminase